MANTGYRINTYIDVNPNSPTFNTTREERVRDDAECGVASASWEEVSSYCELDDDGGNTGYYVTTTMDTNPSSPTYGETRDSRTYNLGECPLPSKDPEWAFDGEDIECEEKLFPKSGLYGQTGRLHAIMTDQNRFSPTYGTTEERYITKEDWTTEMEADMGAFPCEAVDTKPQIEPITEACETVTDEYGTLVYNGYKTVTGIDRNPYSDTYLESVTDRVEDNVKCPAAESAVFEFKDGNDEHLTTKNISVEYYKRDYTIYVTSMRGSGVLPYTVQIPNASWLSYSRPNDEVLTFTFEKNMNVNARSQTVTLVQERTSKEIKLNMTQDKPPYYFYLDNSSTTAKTLSVGSSSTSSTVNITSLWGDEYKDYNTSGLPTWVSVSRNSSSKTITFSVQANTATTSRSATITLTQDTSGKRCTVTINQSGYTPQTSDYVFEITETSIGNTNWGSNVSLTYTESSTSKYVAVTSNNGFGTDVMWGYSYESGSDWLNVVKQGNVLRVYPNENTSTASRSGKIKLEQDGSNKVCYINVTQSGKALVAYNFQVSSAQSGSYSNTVTRTVSQGIGTFQFYVKSSSTVQENLAWTYEVRSGSEWIKIPSSTDSMLVVTIDGNNGNSTRTGVIRLTQTESQEICTITLIQEGKGNENTPEYVQTYGEKFSYGATGNYDASQLWVVCDSYSIDDGFYNAGSETQNSGDIYVLDKFFNNHSAIEFRVYGRDSGIDKLEFYFGDYKFKYLNDSDFNVKYGQACKVNTTNVMVRVTRLSEIPMALSEDDDTE